MAKIFGTTVDSLLNTSSDFVIDVSDLTEKERQAVLDIVDCLKSSKSG